MSFSNLLHCICFSLSLFSRLFRQFSHTWIPQDVLTIVSCGCTKKLHVSLLHFWNQSVAFYELGELHHLLVFVVFFFGTLAPLRCSQHPRTKGSERHCQTSPMVSCPASLLASLLIGGDPTPCCTPRPVRSRTKWPPKLVFLTVTGNRLRCPDGVRMRFFFILPLSDRRGRACLPFTFSKHVLFILFWIRIDWIVTSWGPKLRTARDHNTEVPVYTSGCGGKGGVTLVQSYNQAPTETNNRHAPKILFT